MPTFTTIALETLLEPRVRDSYKKPLDSKQVISKSLRDDADDGRKEEKKKMKTQTPNHIYISPALYITPEPAPIPDTSSESLSPSPYVVNHKRRGGEAVIRRIGGFEVQQQKVPDVEGNSNGVEDDDKHKDSNVDSSIQVQEEVIEDNCFGVESNGYGNESFVVEDDDFFDPRCDSLSVTSSNELNDIGKQAENQSAVSHPSEFFDANEDFSSDGSLSNLPYGPSLELELCATKLSLLEEIERRKTAEDAHNLMYSQWQRVSNHLSQVGLTFPAPSNACGAMQLEINSIEQFSQEIVVARFVSEAIGKGQARAEAETAAEAIIESKDQEISRLRDRLQYYEAVNHEMSQRNQEVMEVARRQRQRKRTQRKWLWGCIGLTVLIGTSVVAYSYLPETSKHHTPLASNDSSNVSDISSSLESASQ